MIILALLFWFICWPLILIGWLLETLGTAIGKAIFWASRDV